MKNEKIVKISSGGLDFQYEIVRTDAPESEIKEAIIKQETAPDCISCNGKAAFEYLEEDGYKYEVLGTNEEETEVKIDYEIDVNELIDETCEEVVINGHYVYRRK